MKIISTTDLSHEGNDCYIHESVTLVEEFGMYTVVSAHKVTGWSEDCDIRCHSTTTCNLDQAKFLYQSCGGELKGD